MDQIIQEPRLSLAGIAKYIVASPSAQRKILGDFKFPDPQGAGQSGYYSDARRAIRRAIQCQVTADSIEAEAARIEKSGAATTVLVAARARNNARAVRAFARNVPFKGWTILPTPRLEFRHAGVRVSAVADLFIRDLRGHERLMKLDFSAEPPENEVRKVVAQVLMHAAARRGLTSVSTAYIHCETGDCERGDILGSVGKRIYTPPARPLLSSGQRCG